MRRVDESLDDEWDNMVTLRPLDGKLVYHLFSGAGGPRDGVRHYVEQLGGVCHEFDILNGEHQNLADEHIWSRLLEEMRALASTGMLAGGIVRPSL